MEIRLAAIRAAEIGKQRGEGDPRDDVHENIRGGGAGELVNLPYLRDAACHV